MICAYCRVDKAGDQFPVRIYAQCVECIDDEAIGRLIDRRSRRHRRLLRALRVRR